MRGVSAALNLCPGSHRVATQYFTGLVPRGLLRALTRPLSLVHHYVAQILLSTVWRLHWGYSVRIGIENVSCDVYNLRFNQSWL